MPCRGFVLVKQASAWLSQTSSILPRWKEGNDVFLADLKAGLVAMIWMKITSLT